MFGEGLAQRVRVLYVVQLTVITRWSFFRQPEIDGALVGGASLDARAFIAISEAAQA